MTEIILGTNTQSDKPVAIGSKDRLRHMYCAGRTGSGKSVFLEQLAVQDAEKGYGFCFMTTAGDVLDHILCRIPQERIDLGDVIFLDPLDYKFPPGLNPYECKMDDPLIKRETANLVEQIFSKIFGMSKDTPRLAMYVRNITATLIENQGMTMCEILPLLLDQEFRARLLANLPAGSGAAHFWKAYDGLRPLDRLQDSESTRDRIDALVNNDILRYIVGQSNTTINFAEIMNTGKILLVRLPGKDDAITTLLGSTIINQLALAAFARDNLPEKKRRQFNIYADEFQRFVSTSFGELLLEGRKYKVGIICANQVLNDLGELLKPRMLNAGCLVVLNVQDEDAQVFAGEFDTTPEKRSTTIPRWVLTYLKDHPSPIVKELWTYVFRLEQALTEREQEEDDSYTNIYGERIKRKITILPTQDFGSGVIVKYEREDVKEARTALNELLYHVLQGDVGKDELMDHFVDVIGSMAELLCYENYYGFFYRKRSDIFTATPRTKIAEEIAQYEQLKGLLQSFQENEESLMRYYAARTSTYKYGDYLPLNPITQTEEYEKAKGCFFAPGYTPPREISDREKLPLLLRKQQEKLRNEIEEYFAKRLAICHTCALRYQSLHTYLAYIMAGYQEIFAKVASTWLFNKNAAGFNPYKNREDFDLLYQLDYMGSPCMVDWWAWVNRWSVIEKVRQKKLRDGWETRLAIDDALVAENRPFHLICSFKEAQEGLASEEGFIRLLTKHIADYELDELSGRVYTRRIQSNRETGDLHWSRINKTPERIRQLLTEDCQAFSAFYAAHNTREKLLAVTRAELAADIAEVEAKLQPLNKERDTYLAKDQSYLDERKAREKARYDKFVNILLAAIDVLPHTIEVPSTTPTGQQTHMDKRAEIANALTHLPVGRAWVRLTTSDGERKVIVEHVIDIPMPSGFSEKELERKKAQVVAYTRANYCTPRREVEEEIRRRHSFDSQPPTQRKHMLIES